MRESWNSNLHCPKLRPVSQNLLARKGFNFRMRVDKLLNRTAPFRAVGVIAGVCAFLLGTVPLAQAGSRTLPGHVPAIVGQLTPLGDLPLINQLHLALGVPLRDQAGLDIFLAQLYDPASPHYHQYITPQQFADQFGPTAGDYQSLIEFAQSNHLAITATTSAGTDARCRGHA